MSTPRFKCDVDFYTSDKTKILRIAPAAGAQTTLQTTSTANTTFTVPDAADTTMVTELGSQVISGVKTFTGDVTVDSATGSFSRTGNSQFVSALDSLPSGTPQDTIGDTLGWRFSIAAPMRIVSIKAPMEALHFLTEGPRGCTVTLWTGAGVELASVFLQGHVIVPYAIIPPVAGGYCVMLLDTPVDLSVGTYVIGVTGISGYYEIVDLNPAINYIDSAVIHTPDTFPYGPGSEPSIYIDGFFDFVVSTETNTVLYDNNTITTTGLKFNDPIAPAYLMTYNPTSARTYRVPDVGPEAIFVTTFGTDTINGAKTFTEDIVALNLAGTNTGDLTLTAVGSAPNAAGASLSGQALTLQPADTTHPGAMTTTAQTIAGTKHIIGDISAPSLSGVNTGDITLTEVGSSPVAEGATLSGQALTLQPANGTDGGLVTAGTQTIGGNKTYTGAVTASNLSGTNTGDVTSTAVGSSPAAAGASLSGQALTLQPASSTQPGVITADTQTIGSLKTFQSADTFATYIFYTSPRATVYRSGSLAITGGVVASPGVVFDPSPVTTQGSATLITVSSPLRFTSLSTVFATAQVQWLSFSVTATLVTPTMITMGWYKNGSIIAGSQLRHTFSSTASTLNFPPTMIIVSGAGTDYFEVYWYGTTATLTLESFSATVMA